MKMIAMSFIIGIFLTLTTTTLYAGDTAEGKKLLRPSYGFMQWMAQIASPKNLHPCIKTITLPKEFMTSLRHIMSPSANINRQVLPQKTPKEQLAYTFKRQKRLLEGLDENLTCASSKPIEILPEDEDLVNKYLDFTLQNSLKVKTKTNNLPIVFQANPHATVLQKILQLFYSQIINSATLESVDSAHFSKNTQVKNLLKMMRKTKVPGLHVILSSTPSLADRNKLTFLKAQTTLNTLLKAMKNPYDYPIKLTLMLHTETMRNHSGLSVDQISEPNPESIFYEVTEPALEIEKFFKFLIFFHSLCDLSLELVIGRHGTVPLEFSFSPLNKEQKKYTNRLEQGDIPFNRSALLSLSEQQYFYDTLFLTDSFSKPSERPETKNTPISKLYLKNLLSVNYDPSIESPQTPGSYSTEQIADFLACYWQLLFLDQNVVDQEISNLKKQSIEFEKTHPHSKIHPHLFVQWYENTFNEPSQGITSFQKK
jgi:hypothetical protein